MSASQNYNVNLNINANAQSAQQQLQKLQQQLQQISTMKVNVGSDILKKDIEEASQAALKLSAHLQMATNTQTGNLDFTKFHSSIKKSNIDLVQYATSLQKLGPTGQQAFVNLAQAIAKAEIPIRRTSQLTQKMWDGFKRTAGWQLQSSLIHGIIGGVQQAVGYAKDLNKSLTDIRIVTGSSADEMARFAQRANEAAKRLSATTTDYTKASLIYYQQGLSDAEVKARAEATIKMSNVTGTSAQQVSDQMTAIWNNYANGSKSLEHYADVMTALGAATASSTDEIAEGLQKFASISNTVGLSYEYAASALATITAESRESADVVGNALKTLFSRIQGLQLGETLDDGTTLNKYSTALAKVGISIKDQTGGLKDMDDILDEMGSKWSTLARDEKMALAQTVAGVRQYTQLMTLMENWDDFKKNLNTANTSTGTLDSQAAIYAESWEAASKRVRASWESLWDKLVQSDGMITLLDSLTYVIDLIDKMVSGIGGASGVFATFGGVLTRVFNKQITEGISNFAYGVKMLFPKNVKAEMKQQETWLTDFKNSMVSGQMGNVGTNEGKVRSDIISKQIDSATRYMGIQNQLTPEQQYYYEHYNQLRAQNEAARTLNAQEQDKLSNELSNITADKIYGRIGGFKKGVTRGLDWDYRAGQEITTTTRRDYFSNLGKQHADTITNLEKIKSLDDFDKSEYASQKGIAELREQLQRDLGTDKNNESAILNKLKGQIIQQSENNIKNKANAMNLTRDEKEALSEEQQAEYRQAYAEYATKKAQIAIKQARGEELSEEEQKFIKEQKEASEPQKQQNKIQGMVAGAQGLMSTVAAISALEGLQDQITALGEGAGSVTGLLSSLGSVAMNGMMGLSGLTSALSSFGVAAAGPWAAAIMGAILVLTQAIKWFDKVNVSEKERVNTLKQSDAELNNATESSKKLIETYQTQNDDYLESVEKVKTSEFTPEEFANEVFQANKQALDLISQYELDSSAYDKNSAGLIEIDKQILEQQEEDIKNASASLERTSSMSGIITQLETLESDLEKDLSASTTVTTNAPYQQGAYPKTATYYKYTDELGNQLTLDQIIEYIGTEKWDTIKDYAKRTGKEKDYEELEKKVLEYQEQGILKDLAMRNNVDYLLQSQDYKVKGTESFAALGYDKYKEEYETSYDTNEFSKSSYTKQDITESMKDIIVQYLKAQGFTGIDRNSISFDGSDISKFTVKHSEGTEDVNLEAVRKYAAEQDASGKTEEVFNQSYNALQALRQRNAEAASGIMSLLTGDNFNTATSKEMEYALSEIAKIAEEVYGQQWETQTTESGERVSVLKEGKEGTDVELDDYIKTNFGMSTAEFRELFNIDPNIALADWLRQFKDMTSSAQKLIASEGGLLQAWYEGTGDWGTSTKQMAENLSQNTLTSLYDNFKKASLLGGEDAGRNLLTGITEVLKSSNLSEDDYDAAVQGLLAIDWSDSLTSAGAAADVISSLGGHLDTTTAAWQAFAAAMAAASGAIPDFSKVINQLTQLAGALQGLSQGDLIDADIVQQLLNINPDLAKYFSKHWSGKYTFTGTNNDIVQDATWDAMNEKKSEASAVQKNYDEYVNSEEAKGKKSNNDIQESDFTDDENKDHAIKLAGIAGYTEEDVNNLITENQKTSEAYAAWTDQTKGKAIDENTSVRKTADGYEETKDGGNTWTKVTDPRLIHQYETQYNADQTAYNTTQGAVDTMVNTIHSLDEVSGEWKPEEIEQAVSTADSAAEVFERINEGQAGLVENGIISDSALKGLEALPGKSEATTEALNALREAKTNLDNAKANKNPYDDEAAQKAYDEAYAQAELSAQIDATATARSLDADALRAKVEWLQKENDLTGMSIEQQVELAAKYLERDKAIEELKKDYDALAKTLDNCAEGSADWNDAITTIKKHLSKITGMKISDISTEFIKAAHASGLLQKALNGNEKAFFELTSTMGLYSAIMEKVTDPTQAAALQKAFSEGGMPAMIAKLGEFSNFVGTDFLQAAQNWNNTIQQFKAFSPEELLNNGTFQTQAASWVGTLGKTMGLAMKTLGDFSAAAQMAGFEMITEDIGEVDLSAIHAQGEGAVIAVPTDDKGGYALVGATEVTQEQLDNAGSMPLKRVKFKPLSGSGASGGGGGGGGKQPKKVAQTRRSQVVKRYKNVDAQRAINKNRRENMSKKTDKLYGESRITNLQKENKLLEEGLKLNEKKAEEALKNLKIDEESLRKMTKKYSYELELDSEGNIKNYEQILGDIYDELHKLELDGELSEEEEKIKEKLEIKKQEIEGAMEDWEDTLKQLEELNNEYEELIDEMHSNELEQITYKLEFELELNELDTEWYDFLNEQIGDDFTQAVDTMDLITEKIKIANDNINLYKQSVTDLMENIENDPNRSLITGYLQDGVLTDEEAEILKEAYSGIIEQLNALAEAKTSAEELLVSIFEGYKERIDFDTTALEHYTSLLEHFGNVVDIVGQKQLGLSDRFMENMAKMRIQQSRDIMSAAQSELAAYEQIRAEAEEELARAREEGRTNDVDYWQQQLDDANTSIQEARDKLVTSFEDNLNAIADAFDKAVERIVQTFNDAVYAFGGLEGLSEDYSFIRENTELMAQDYEKIYELSKLNRNINKTLNDNNIIAGKQKMIELQKEINDLQASGAELSKYDLEYLQAKYELRLAEIELENAQNAKETVRLSKDSEGNWSYVYTASTEKIDEAQQKYEDALYKMQNLSYEYIDEMSEKIISASQAMMEEIQNLNKNNFENEQEYLAEINRIKAKYAESLGVTEEELNKALANNEELYDKDWQSYSNKTGYAISESQNWIDRYAESTLGTLMKSTSDVANYMDNFSLALDELTNSLYRVAGDYYNGIDDAFAAAGITKEDFASFVTTNTKAIMDASTNTKKDIETQTSTLVKEYSIQADKVTDIQRILDTAIDVYGPYIREIRDILRESAALTKELQNKDATYTYKQAADLFNSKYGEDYKIEMDAEGRWKKTVEGVKNEILQKHAEAKTDEEKKHYADMYTWLTSYILPYVTSLDTGGYTGEWGTSGRLAMLHEKELILNASDTANFLDALNVSRELVNRVIEMNARASSFGIGGLSPSSIQDFAQNLEQQVTITAEFPNAVDHNEIEEAFASLINTASQYANRK